MQDGREKCFDASAQTRAGCGAWNQGLKMVTTYSFKASWYDDCSGHSSSVLERYTDVVDKPIEEVRRDIQTFLAACHPRFIGLRPEDIEVQLARYA